ncbi:hypothetical protein F4777DRAFT_557303 [Nemania sp. FL0916]|nr:hypothetical protein F4777DRAFT_557303 [Nemania sp. FL0916]
MYFALQFVLCNTLCCWVWSEYRQLSLSLSALCLSTYSGDITASNNAQCTSYMRRSSLHYFSYHKYFSMVPCLSILGG